MKLIDLLVQELPKRGGWPDGAECSTVIEYHMGGDLLMEFIFPSMSNNNLKAKNYQIIINNVGYIERISSNHTITKEQYESALSASQKLAWNGEGVPPVGCECEYQYKVHGSEWCRFECVAVDGKAVFGWSNNTPIALQSNTHNFRPLRTEAERKHEAVLESICAVLEMVAQDYKREDEARLIYEAIAAGKIPGVKLDD